MGWAFDLELHVMGTCTSIWNNSSLGTNESIDECSNRRISSSVITKALKLVDAYRRSSKLHGMPDSIPRIR